MASATIDLDIRSAGPEAIASDVTNLVAASSYVEPVAGRQDPRARAAFEIVATDYCSGGKLIIPLPKKKTGQGALFLDLWRAQPTVTKIPDLEFSDSGFAEVSESLTPGLVDYIEGDPKSVAQWVAFQFSADFADSHLERSDLIAIYRAGPVARKLHDAGSLKQFEQALLDENFREPAAYGHRLGSHELPSFTHLCIAYVLSVALRRYAYALAMGNVPDDPLYHHHWIGNPVLNSPYLQGLTRSTESESVTRFPWGALLRGWIDRERQRASLDAAKVRDVLVGLREVAGQFSAEYVRLPLWADVTMPPDQLTEREALIIKTLQPLGIVPSYSSTVRAEKLASWLRGLAESQPAWKFFVERVTRNMQPRWLRQYESKLRMAYRSDTFWQIFDDAGLRALVRKAAGAGC